MPTPKLGRPNSCCRTEALRPFVIASETRAASAACNLLFTSPHDLVWGNKRYGYFVVDAPPSASLSEELELASATTDSEVMELLSRYFPVIKPLLFEVVSTAFAKKGRRTKDKINEAIAQVIARHTQTPDHPIAQLIPLASDGFHKSTFWLSSKIARSALAMRDRQLAATGIALTRYDEMVRSLRLLGVARPQVQLAYAAGARSPEIVIPSSERSRALTLASGSTTIEILRLEPALASARRGEDKGLACFIADYINHGTPLGQSAFACARFGQQNSPEFDVLVPDLRLGFEVKVFQGAFVKSTENLHKAASEFAKQAAGYFAVGVRELYFVTNLDQATAEALLEQARERDRTLQRASIKVSSGAERLISDLRDVVKRAAKQSDAALELEFKQARPHARARTQRGHEPKGLVLVAGGPGPLHPVQRDEQANTSPGVAGKDR